MSLKKFTISHNEGLLHQEAFYNARWKDVEYANTLKLLRCIAILSAIAETRLREPKILELGCGTGWLSGIMGNWGPTTGIDFSSAAIEKAKQKYPYVKFMKMDISSMSHSNEVYDLIVSHEVIEHLNDQKQHIADAYNLLRPGGALILTTPNRYIFENFPKEMQLSWSNQPIEKWLSLTDLKKITLPYFEIAKLRTIIPGYDPKGMLRYLNSYRLRRFLKLIGLLKLHEEMCLSLGWGLHILMIAYKRHLITSSS